MPANRSEVKKADFIKKKDALGLPGMVWVGVVVVVVVGEVEGLDYC